MLGESVVSVAVYVTDSGVPSFTVKVATPLALVTALAGVMVELPEPAASVTVIPETAFGVAAPSFSVTVMVDVVVLSAGTEIGLAETVELAALPRVTVRVAEAPADVLAL